MPTTQEVGQKYKSFVEDRIIYACNQKVVEMGLWIEILEKSNTGWTPHQWLDGHTQFFICGNEKATVALTVPQLLNYGLMHAGKIKNIKTSIGFNIPFSDLQIFKSFNNMNVKKDTKIKDLIAIAAKLGRAE